MKKELRNGAIIRAAIGAFVGLVFSSSVATASDHDADRLVSESTVKHLAEAIAFKTVSLQDRSKIDYTEYTDFLAYLRQTYPRVFTELRVDVIADYSLVITWEGSDGNLDAVLFDSHYDVVPVEPGTEGDWIHAPYSGAVADGYLWGRGALDDKATVITTLEAMETLLGSGFQPARTLLFSFAHDEEIGGNSGAANIVKHLESRNVKLAYMVGEGGQIVEGSPLREDGDVAMIGLSEKGYITLKFYAEGDGGHSSAPVENNALIRLAKAMVRLHENPFDTELVSPVTDMLKVVGKAQGGIKGFVYEQQWLTEPLLLSVMEGSPSSQALIRNTTAVTMFNAGVKENVISQRAEATANFRLLPGYSQQRFLDRIAEIIDDDQIEIEVLTALGVGVPVADVDGVGFQRVKQAILKVHPDALVAPSLLGASTDSPHYVNIAPDIYRFHPFSVPLDHADTVHGTNERISLQSLSRAMGISTELIRSVSAP